VPLDPTQISALTFDCYGTLVDWETGILATLKDVLSRHDVEPPPDSDLLTMYAEVEARQEEGDYQPYRDVLACVMISIASDCGVSNLPEDDQDELAESLPRWPVFPDTTPFLRAAASKFKLCICSNIDDDLFEGTRRALGAPVDFVVTAERCGSYKPNPRHFELALDILQLPSGRVLHVAESRRHDIEPAKKLGFQTCWVNRHKARPGPSASGQGHATPDLEVASLAELGERLFR
jgi:2-haloacid dehalogenase